MSKSNYFLSTSNTIIRSSKIFTANMLTSCQELSNVLLYVCLFVFGRCLPMHHRWFPLVKSTTTSATLRCTAATEYMEIHSPKISEKGSRQPNFVSDYSMPWFILLGFTFSVSHAPVCHCLSRPHCKNGVQHQAPPHTKPKSVMTIARALSFLLELRELAGSPVPCPLHLHHHSHSHSWSHWTLSFLSETPLVRTGGIATRSAPWCFITTQIVSGRKLFPLVGIVDIKIFHAWSRCIVFLSCSVHIFATLAQFGCSSWFWPISLLFCLMAYIPVQDIVVSQTFEQLPWM